ncbi:MAG: prolyl oligopeptidase family serine peptidase [Gemmatimonadaceae bacterium]
MRAPLLLASLALVSPPAFAAQETPSDTLLTVGHYLDFESVGDPQISPDGSRIVYTRRWVNRLEDKWESALWIMSADGSRNRFLVKGASARWAPDGKRIAYLADGEPKGSQIFVRWMDVEGAPSQVTRVMESPADLRWSPDGKTIGFSMFVPKPAEWKIDLPAAPKGAKWTGAPRLVEQLHYRQDRRGFSETGHTHLFVVPADGGSPRQITSGNWSVGARFDGLGDAVAWDWTPDGRTIVVDGFSDSTADLNYRESNIYSVDVEKGTLRRLTPEAGIWTSPVVSPNGKMVAFTGYPATKQIYKVADLYTMNIDGSGMKKITGDFDRDPRGVQWASDAGGLFFFSEDRGSVNVFHTPLGGGGVKPVTSGVQTLFLTSLARNGIGAGVRSTPHLPTDVVRINLAGGKGAGAAGTVTQLTRVNEDMLARKKLGAVEEVWYTSTGGTKVQGWIVKPPSFDASKKYPLILEIHGGPTAMYNVGFSYMFQNFAANGFVVLYTNPRGSTGYGTTFGNAIDRAYPSVDYDDLMAGVDTLVGRGYIDDRNMFVGGCSGGGVLSSWVIGHTTRFAAAAVRCPVTNWLSFAGQTDVPLFTHNFFEAPFWEKPEQWLKQSPLMYVGNVKTPTLIMTGELDLRTPITQSDEYYAALKMRGVPTALLRFEGEYHGTGSKPSNFMRTQLYMMSWFKRYSSPKTTAAKD